MSDLSETQRLVAARHLQQLRAVPDVPVEGIVYVDREGLRWLCQAVILSAAMSGYYLVRLVRVENDQAVGAPLVLAPSEYETFRRDRLLKPESPGESTISHND